MRVERVRATENAIREWLPLVSSGDFFELNRVQFCFGDSGEKKISGTNEKSQNKTMMLKIDKNCDLHFFQITLKL